MLHTTTHYVNALVAEAVARSLGLPWVYEVRGQLERTWVASHPPAERAAVLASERYRLWRDRELEMALAADHVVVLSTVLRDHLVGAGLPAASVTVVPNAVDARTAHGGGAGDPGRCPARARAARQTDSGWARSPRSSSYEGLDVLLRAVAILRGRGLDVRCALVGDGVARPDLLAPASTASGSASTPCFPGRVDLDRRRQRGTGPSTCSPCLAATWRSPGR